MRFVVWRIYPDLDEEYPVARAEMAEGARAKLLTVADALDCYRRALPRIYRPLGLGAVRHEIREEDAHGG